MQGSHRFSFFSIVKGMSKLSISQQGIQIETHEKSNVMSPCHTMAYVVLPAAVLLLLMGTEFWIKLLGALVFLIFVLSWIVIYICHNIKKPELLQSEVFRLERQKIESGMIENKHGNNSERPELLATNITPKLKDTGADIDG